MLAPVPCGGKIFDLFSELMRPFLAEYSLLAPTREWLCCGRLFSNFRTFAFRGILFGLLEHAKHIQISQVYHCKQKAHGLSKNLVCEQSPNKGSGDENKTNAFIRLIKEQRHRDFLRVYSLLH